MIRNLILLGGIAVLCVWLFGTPSNIATVMLHCYREEPYDGTEKDLVFYVSRESQTVVFKGTLPRRLYDCHVWDSENWVCEGGPEGKGQGWMAIREGHFTDKTPWLGYHNCEQENSVARWIRRIRELGES